MQNSDRSTKQNNKILNSFDKPVEKTVLTDERTERERENNFDKICHPSKQNGRIRKMKKVQQPPENKVQHK